MGNIKKKENDLIDISDPEAEDGAIIDIDDLPGTSRLSKWPYDHWEEVLEEGKAMEITHLITEGQDPSGVASTIQMSIRRKELSIQAVVRGDRIWIIKRKPVELEE